MATAGRPSPAVQSFSARLGRNVYFLRDHESYLFGGPAIQAAMEHVRRALAPHREQRAGRAAAGTSRRAALPPGSLRDRHPTFGIDVPIDGDGRRLVGFPARSEQGNGTGDAVRALELVRSGTSRTVSGLDGWCFGSYPRTRLPPWITHYPAPNDAELHHLCNHTAVFIVPSLHEGFGPTARQRLP